MVLHVSPEGLRQRDLLEAAVDAAQPTRTQHKQAVRVYRKVGEWLADPECDLAPFRPDIFPQGSFLLGTVVQPHWQHEFDLDLVVKLYVDCDSANSDHMAGMIRDRLLEDGDLANRLDLDRFPRCIRLFYAGDFHLDVVTACPAADCSEMILIPEKEELRRDNTNRSSWKLTDPIGYARWFDGRNAIGEGHHAIFKAAIAPEPTYQTGVEKTPLRKFVQLIKLRRNRFYEPEDAPSSILLTTMAGECYGGQGFSTEGLAVVVDAMSAWAQDQGDDLVVGNPTIPTENFAEPLSSARKRILRNFLSTFAVELHGLSREVGLDRQGAALRKMVGDQPIDGAFHILGEAMKTAKDSGQLATSRKTGMLGGVAAGITGTLPKPNPPHTFYGG